MARSKDSAGRSVGARPRSVVRESAPWYDSAPTAWKASSTPDRETPLLLDTHVWIWSLNKTSGRLPAAAWALIEHAAVDRRLFVSDFSFWEVGMLASKSRLPLIMDPPRWLARAAKAPGIVTVPISRDVLVQSNELPGASPKDPADRILIAQARTLGASLFTCDRGIIDYAARTPGIPVCDARA